MSWRKNHCYQRNNINDSHQMEHKLKRLDICHTGIISHIIHQHKQRLINNTYQKHIHTKLLHERQSHLQFLKNMNQVYSHQHGHNIKQTCKQTELGT